ERPLVPTLFARTFVDWRNAHVPFADARIAPAARESAQAIGTIESRRAAPRFRIESGSRAKRGRPRERPFGVTREARVREAHGPTADAPWASLERSGTPRPRPCRCRAAHRWRPDLCLEPRLRPPPAAAIRCRSPARGTLARG